MKVPVLFEEILAVDCWGKKRPFSSGMLAHGPVNGTIPIYIQEALNELLIFKKKERAHEVVKKRGGR